MLYSFNWNVTIKEKKKSDNSSSSYERHHHYSKHRDLLGSSSSSSHDSKRNREESIKNSLNEDNVNPDDLKTVKVREIWVGNLPNEINEQILHKTFFIYGEISKIEINPRKNYAFIRYKLCSSASRAYEKAKNMVLGGKVLRISFSDSGKRREIIGDEPGYELSEQTCKLLHVSLNKNTTIADENIIKDIFNQFGSVKYLHTKSCLGFRPSIYIEYSKCEEAKEAIKELNKESKVKERTALGDPYCEINYYFKKKNYQSEGMNTTNNSNVNNYINENPNMNITNIMSQNLFNKMIHPIIPPIFPMMNQMGNYIHLI